MLRLKQNNMKKQQQQQEETLGGNEASVVSTGMPNRQAMDIVN